jgi:Tol biopolymer transport system component
MVYARLIARSNVALATERGPGSGRFDVLRLTEGTALRSSAVLSPDGAKVAYAEERAGATDLFVVPAGGGTARQVTTGGRVGGGPAWSPDGSALAFVGRVQGAARVLLLPWLGSEEHVFAHTQVGEGDIVWAPGAQILYQRPGNHNFNWLDARTEAESALVKNPEAGWMFEPVPSPDGRRVAVDWNRPPEPGVYVVSPGDTLQRLVVVRAGRGLIRPVGWTADGKGVYVRRFTPDDIALFPVTGGPPRRVLALPAAHAQCQVREFPRGIRMTCVLPESESDALMLEGFDGRRR